MHTCVLPSRYLAFAAVAGGEDKVLPGGDIPADLLRCLRAHLIRGRPCAHLVQYRPQSPVVDASVMAFCYDTVHNTAAMRQGCKARRV